MVDWDRVTRDDVLRAIQDYDRLGPERFFAEHGFGPTTTYDLVRDERLVTRRKRLRAPPMSSPPASVLAPGTSKAVRPAPSPCSEA